MKKPKLAAMEPPADDQPKEYELKSMADHLLKAHEIQNDEGLMAKLQPHLHKKLKALKSLGDLKKVAHSRIKEINTDESL